MHVLLGNNISFKGEDWGAIKCPNFFVMWLCSEPALVGTNCFLIFFFFFLKDLYIYGETYWRSWYFYSTLHSERSVVAGRLVSGTSEKPWAIPTLVLEKMAVLWWVWRLPGSSLHLRVHMSSCFSLSGPLAHLFYGCYKESCCVEAVIAELVESGSQALSFLYLLLLLQKYLCKKLMSSAVCLYNHCVTA